MHFASQIWHNLQDSLPAADRLRPHLYLRRSAILPGRDFR